MSRLASVMLLGSLLASCGDEDAPAPATPAAPPPAAQPVDPPAIAPLVGWPTENPHVTSAFGWRVDPVSGKGTRLHKGIDLRGPAGELVLSIHGGTVAFAGTDPLLGNMVIVDHGQGIESLYGHMQDLLVHTGLPVERGTALGLVGNTGRSAAPHLHLTVKVDGVAIDPLLLIGHPLHRPDLLVADRPAEPEAGDTDETGEPDADPSQPVGGSDGESGIAEPPEPSPAKLEEPGSLPSGQ